MTLRMPDPVPLTLDEVIALGRPIIDDIVLNLAAVVELARRQPAYWHPTGFIVMNLRDVQGLGLVRLHIWSKAGRNKRAGNPEIHAHVFHLTSYVLVGEYVEHQYRERFSPEGELYGYLVVPPTGDGIDRIVPDGRRYDLDLIKTERSTAGSFHHLPAGIYHLTDNPEAETCATIALISRPQPGRVDHLIGPELHDGLESRRDAVDDATLAAAISEIGVS